MNKIAFFLLLFNLFFQVAKADLDYDFSNTFSIPIKLSILEEVSTKKFLNEGELLNFKIIENVILNGETIVKKGEIIQGRIENIITSGMNGFPAEITIDNFKIPNIDSSKLISTYTKTGFNRCYFVFPLKWALTPIPFAGSVTNFIKGGHARIKPSDVIIVQYYPQW